MSYKINFFIILGNKYRQLKKKNGFKTAAVIGEFINKLLFFVYLRILFYQEK